MKPYFSNNHFPYCTLKRVGVMFLLAWMIVILFSTPYFVQSAVQASDSVVHSVAWSPDSSMIAVGYGTSRCVPNRPDLYTIQILNVATNQVIRTLAGSDCSVSSLDWSPDGSKLASASLDGIGVRVWDVASGQLVVTKQTILQGNSDVSWKPDGTQLAITDYFAESVLILDAATGEIVKSILTYGTSVDWSPDGSKLVSGSEGQNEVYISDALSEQELMALGGHSAPIHSVAWSPDGSKLASGGEDNTVRIWNATTGASLLVLLGHTDFVTEAVWSPDGSHVASSSADGTIRVWNAATGEQVGMIQESEGVFTLAWSPDGTRLAYNASDGTLKIELVPGLSSPSNGPIVYVSKRTGNWDVYKMNPDGSDDTNLTSNYTGKDWAPSWSPDGTQIVFESLRHHASGEIYSMNADGSNVTRLTNNTFLDTEPDYSPDGSQIVFVSARNGTDDEIWVMNADGSGQTLLYDSPGDDNLPVWSPDGTKVAFCSDQSGNWEIYVMPSTGGTATNLTNHSSMDRNPAWSADGSQIAWVSNRSFVDIYAMPATGGTATNLSNHSDYDSYPSYSPDGTLMAFTSNRDGDQEVWTMTVAGASPVQLTFNTAIEWYPDWVALTAGNQALLSAPAVVEAAIPDNTPRPGRLTALPRGKSEQTHANLFYVGAWVDETAAGASVRTTHSIGGEVWFAFRGRQVILHVVKRPDALPIEVCIDDVCQTVDLYSAQPSLSSITLGDLSAGTHTVHLRNDSAGYLSLDAIEVP